MGGRKREKDPFFSRGRSNLGRAKQTRPRNRGRGVGGVRKGRDDATGREIFGGERGSSMVGGRVFGWALLGRYRVVSSSSTKAQRLLLLFALFSFFLGKLRPYVYSSYPTIRGIYKGFYTEC